MPAFSAVCPQLFTPFVEDRVSYCRMKSRRAFSGPLGIGRFQ
jgi:hypothetical protein